jgi:hypothetical protein
MKIAIVLILGLFISFLQLSFSMVVTVHQANKKAKAASTFALRYKDYCW